MKRVHFVLAFVISASFAALVLAENGDATSSGAAATESSPSASSASETTPRSDEMISSEPAETPKVAVKKSEKKRIETADSFVAGPEWEFDGFVAGGQDEGVKSMFYQGDLVYLNIGSQQGLTTGDRVALFKRGDKVKDPQSGKFIGFEVRRAGIAQVTDQVSDNTCSVRIIKTIEAVEIKDLAKRVND
jgi:hypothetical protein